MRPFVKESVARHLANVAVFSALPASTTDAATRSESPSSLIIGTHDGTFHCDEAMACGLLRHTAEFATANILRTRDESLLAQCNIVVDVGAKYDPSTHRYDHHQKEFQDTMATSMSQYATRLSSAGLVYKHFGHEVISRYVATLVDAGLLPAPLSTTELDLIYDRMYRNFVEQVDGIDNGRDEYSIQFTPADGTEDGKKPDPPQLIKNYRTSTSLSARVGSLAPRWNEPQGRDAMNAAFSTAVSLATGEFFDQLDFYLCSWMPARTVVADAFAAAKEIHPSGQILVLTRGGAPWREHLLDIEREHNSEGHTLYVLFPDGSVPAPPGHEKGAPLPGPYRVQAVPKDIGGSSFGDRKSLPWKGLRDSALSDASGIPGGIFVHVSGFIGGNRSYEGALQMAVKATEA